MRLTAVAAKAERDTRSERDAHANSVNREPCQQHRYPRKDKDDGGLDKTKDDEGNTNT